MARRRTTILLDEDALATLALEGRRRNVSIPEIVREAFDVWVVELRSGRQPRMGIARSTDGLSSAESAAEPIAEPPAQPVSLPGPGVRGQTYRPT